MLLRSLLVLSLALPVAACSDLAALDTDGDTAPLTSDEQATVRVQVDKALAEQRYKVAWNQEVAAGADRGRLEAIALAALEAQSGHADDMFVALRAKHGGLSASARERVDGLVAQARESGSWARALDLEIVTADDPPAFTRAWSVYRAAPPDRATSLLESIQEAKNEAAAAKESSD